VLFAPWGASPPTATEVSDLTVTVLRRKSV
jgi:hypothetical protein